MAKTKKISRHKHKLSSKHKLSKSKHKISQTKLHYTDEEMGKICTTGQYSTYAGNFYKKKENLEKFKKIKEEFKKNTKYKHLKSHTQRYAQYLKDNFLGKDISKVVNQVKNDFYSYVNDEWVKANQ